MRHNWKWVSLYAGWIGYYMCALCSGEEAVTMGKKSKAIRFMGGVLAAVLALSSVICLVFGIFNFHRNQNLSNRVFDILAKYKDAYPMPEQETRALNRLFSGPGTVSGAVISYWGPIPNGEDDRMQRAAYSYDTEHPALSTISLHESEQPIWYVELSEYREPAALLRQFLAAALILFLLDAGLWLGALKSRKIQRRSHLR